MKRIAALTLATTLAASGSAFAGHDDYGYEDDSRYGYQDDQGRYEDGPRYDMAQVVSVEPIVERSEAVARRECWNEPRAYRERAYRGHDRYYARRHGDSRPGDATVLGAIIGGALGHQAGKGDGRTAATIAGAVIGGAIGHSVAKENRNHVRAGASVRYEDGYRGDGYHGGEVRQCRTVGGYEQDERVVGYRVAFDYHGRIYHTTTSHHPGDSIRVRVDVTAEDDRVVGY